jgi:hypothetical protein
MPQRLTAHDALGQNVEFFSRAGGRFSRGEFVVLGGRKILVMAVLQNRFENIPHLPHRITPSNSKKAPTLLPFAQQRHTLAPVR